MRRKSHVRFGERDGGNRSEQSLYGVPVPTLRAVEPSQEDLDLTYDCIQLGKQLDIALLDHLIIGAGCWVSVGMWLKQREVELEGQKAA